VHLLHEEIQLIQAVEGGSVFFGVKLKRLLQSKEYDTALVLYLVAHV
jgi:hypothetical protein